MSKLKDMERELRMTKEEVVHLRLEAERSRCRVAQLEHIICPGGQHDWHEDVNTNITQCKKCGKVF